MSVIEVLSKEAGVSMTDDWYTIAEPGHFWIRWRFEVFKNHFVELLPKDIKILEVGCGNGLFKEQIESLGYIVDGCDLNMYALKLAKKGMGKLLYYNIFDFLPEFKENFDVIILADVIEHIDNDVNFIEAVKFYLKPGGSLIINVPCYKHLFSLYDKEAGHIRRYTVKTIRSLARKCNLEVNKILMWGYLLYPIAIMRKIFLHFVKRENIIKSGFKPPHKTLNNCLLNYSKVESKISSIVLPGSSIMCLLKKGGS